MTSKLISVVIPAFNEQANLGVVLARTGQVLDLSGYAWELIVVDDGSSDGTFAEARKAADGTARVRALRLSRNCGSHIAISAGLFAARGDACLVMTADLEEPPEMIPRFLEQWACGYEIVWGIRAGRVESLGTRLMSRLFHRLYRTMGLPEAGGHAIGGGFFLIDRKVVESLCRIKERNRTLVGLLSWIGYRQGYVDYLPSHRHSGRSRWTLAKKAKLAIDSFASFSYVPIRLVSVLGISIALLSFVYGLVIIANALVNQVTVQGWPTLMVTVLFLSGLQLLVSGMLGEYIWRTLDETRERPLYFVADSVGFDPPESASPVGGSRYQHDAVRRRDYEIVR